MGRLVAGIATLIIVIASALIPTSQGTGAWLMATIPLSPVIFAIIYYFACRIDPPESEVKKYTTAEFLANKRRMAVKIIPLIVLVTGLLQLLFSPTPAENELQRLDGRLTALNWNSPSGFHFRVSVQEDPQDRPGNHPIRFEFRSALIQSADLIARLERDRPSLLGQRAVVGYYPGSRDIFTLQIAGVDYRTYQQGQTAHWWWRLEGLAIALAGLLLWAAARVLRLPLSADPPRSSTPALNRASSGFGRRPRSNH